MRLAFFALAPLTLGCFGSGMGSAARHTGQNPRSDTVINVAAHETGCSTQDLRIVVETGRRYVNETAFRFVLEGCGERLGFVEQCDLGEPGPGAVAVNDSIACRYLLVSRLPLGPRPARSAP